MGRIAAGTPIEAMQTRSHTINVPPDMLGSGEHYALEVRGDSMVDAGILDGDMALIQRNETAETGDIVVALIDEEEATLKRFRRRGASIALEPANTSYEVRILPPNRVKIQGKLIGLFRARDRRRDCSLLYFTAEHEPAAWAASALAAAGLVAAVMLPGPARPRDRPGSGASSRAGSRDFARCPRQPLRAPTHSRAKVTRRCYTRRERLDEGACGKRRRALARAAGDLCPAIAQSDRAIEHQPIGCRVRIAAEITLTFELDSRRRNSFFGQCRFDARIRDDFARVAD
jgi:hypothetical protein